MLVGSQAGRGLCSPWSSVGGHAITPPAVPADAPRPAINAADETSGHPAKPSIYQTQANALLFRHQRMYEQAIEKFTLVGIELLAMRQGRTVPSLASPSCDVSLAHAPSRPPSRC